MIGPYGGCEFHIQVLRVKEALVLHVLMQNPSCWSWSWSFYYVFLLVDPKWKWSCESVIVKVILYYCDSKTIHQVWSYSPYAWYISWDCIVGSQISERKCARRVRLMWITIICIYHGIFPCYICQPMHIPDSRGLRGVRKKGNQTTVQQFDGLDLISLLLFLVI